jgi:5-hydroxyisourate hydrolase-like protein (transthyretin family)
MYQKRNHGIPNSKVYVFLQQRASNEIKKMNIKICDFDFLIKEEYIKKENVHDTSFAIKYILLFTKSQNWET